ncbi:MAG: response regulator [Candidatus Omnitrophica bacterium]|nr:response regulator [Candidatus Omnitrophota bacterium]
MAKILIVDDNLDIRELLYKVFSKRGFAVTTVPYLEQAQEIIFKEPFDLIISDFKLADGSGIDFLKKVRQYNQTIPVVIFSGVITDELERDAKAIGVNYIYSKEIDIFQFVSEIEKILQVNEADLKKQNFYILIVDDEEGIRRVLCEFCKNLGYKTIEAKNGKEAIQIVNSENISVVLLDMRMPEMDGIQTLQKLLEINPKLKIIMITAVDDEDKVKKTIELGASGYLLKPFDFVYLELLLKSFFPKT